MLSRTIAIKAITCVCLALSVNAFSQIDLNKRDTKNYNKAITYAENTNNKKAIAILRKIHEKNPDEINVNFNLGLCYMNMSGNPDSSIYFLNRVKELDTDGWSDERAELFLAIARAYQLKYDFETPLTYYNEIDANDTEGTFKERTKHEREICKNASILVSNPVKLSVKKMGDEINSEDNDYRPVVTPDMQTLFFSSRRKTKLVETVIYDDGQHEETIFVSHKDGSGWEKAKHIDTLFPDEEFGQETATCISKNGTELYLIRDGNIYVSEFDSASGVWGEAKALPEPINTSRSEESSAFVSNDGEIMFFCSNREGGYGGVDIYRSYRLPNGNWGVPQNVGDVINTPYNEYSPIMHPTQNILYFSSMGHNTMGGYDIFYSIVNADSTFAAVSNIGHPINTPDDDVHFVPTTEKNLAFYSSIIWDSESNGSNGFDIYEVEYEEPEINKLAVVEGTIKSQSNNRVLVTAESAGEIVGHYAPNHDTNKFVLILEVGENYTIKANNGSSEIKKTITVTNAEAYNLSGNTLSLGVFDFGDENEETAAAASAQNGDAASTASTSTSGNAENATAASSSFKDSASASKNKDAMTVQIFSLREKLDPADVRGLDSSELIEHQYKDGWFVYSVGEYDTMHEANTTKDKVISETPYTDAFVRRIANYDKFTK